jgi:hypothetical protein
MARSGDHVISLHTVRLRSILAALEFSSGERHSDLREQARQAIADVRSARQRESGHADVEPGATNQ